MPRRPQHQSADAPPASPARSTVDEGAVSARWKWVELTLILCVFFVEGGAPAPHVNETHYLAKAKHYWDASFCPGDLFLDSADAHLAFYWSVGWLTMWLPLPAVAWIGRLAAWGLLAWAWRRLSIAVVPRPMASVLGATLWVALVQRYNFAGEWVVGGVEAKCFAYALVLLGLEALVRGQWTFARTPDSPGGQPSTNGLTRLVDRTPPWVWFGIASSFHVLVGGWAVITALGVFALEPRGRRPPLAALLPSLALGAICALLGMVPALLLDRGATGDDASEAARIYVFDRLRHHLAPLTMPTPELHLKLRRFAGLLAVFGCLWTWWFIRRRRGPVASAASGQDDDEARAGRLQPVIHFAVISVLLAAAGLGIEAALAGQPLLAANVLRFYWFRQADVAVPLAVALLTNSVAADAFVSRAARGVDARDWRNGGSLVRTLFASTAVAWAAWYMVHTARQRGLAPVPPADRNIADLAEWSAACHWIREHAPPDAVFLVPRHAQSFKWYAHRADVANWKDIPQDAASVVEWRQRCRDLFQRVDEEGAKIIMSTPERLGTAEIRALAKQYGATHVIGRQYPPLDLPRLYPTQAEPNAWYAVYAIADHEDAGDDAANAPDGAP